MRELIHPILGTRRAWPEAPIRAAVSAVPSTARDRTELPLMRDVTAAKIEQHSLGLLMTPVKPDRARSVLWQALSGDLYSQWELFCLMEDGWDRLTKNLNEVKNAVKRLTWTVTPYSERGEKPTPSAQEKADLVEAALKNWEPTPGTLEYGFEDFLYNGLDAMSKGLSVQEIHWQIRNGAVIPRAAHLLTPRQYGWNGDGTRIGLTSAGDPSQRSSRFQWEQFPEHQFVIGQWHSRSGAPGATALLRPLVPYWIGMTYGWRWLMQTAQLFGVPFRWATYDQNEPGLGDRIGELLEKMGSSGWAAFPAGTTLEFKEAVTSARDNPQVVIGEKANKACDLLILGQELSGESQASGLGSGNAMLQGQVRQDVLRYAAAWAADLVSYQLVASLLQMNFGETSESPIIRPDLSIDPEPKSLADRDQVLSALGMKLPTKWMYERHGVPEPEEGETVIEPPATPGFGGFGMDGFGSGFGGGQMQAHQCGQARPIFARNATEQLVDNTLENLTGVQARWLGALKPVFRRLIAAARNERVSDAELVQTLEAAQAEFPELFGKLNHQALADALEAAMGAAVVNGAVRGYLERGGPNKPGGQEP